MDAAAIEGLVKNRVSRPTEKRPTICDWPVGAHFAQESRFRPKYSDGYIDSSDRPSVRRRSSGGSLLRAIRRFCRDAKLGDAHHAAEERMGPKCTSTTGRLLAGIVTTLLACSSAGHNTFDSNASG